MTAGTEHQLSMGFPDPLRTHDTHGLTTHTRAESMGSGRKYHAAHARADLSMGGRLDNSGGVQHNIGAGAVRAMSGAGGRGAIGTMVMIYGTAEVCARTQCGLTFVPSTFPISKDQQR